MIPDRVQESACVRIHAFVEHCTKAEHAVI